MPPTITVKPMPPLMKQLQTGSSTEGSDCGVCTDYMALMFASSNRLRPSRTDRTAAQWVAVLRRRMDPDATGGRPTNVSDAEECLEHGRTDADLAEVGHAPIDAVKYLPGTHDQVVGALRRGRYVGLCIDYGKLNDTMPSYSGSETFRGGHMVGLVGYASWQGQDWAIELDPLHDGRRKGIPLGPKVVRLDKLLPCASAFFGQAGKASFYSVKRSDEVKP